MTADSAKKHNIPISVCGAMASTPKYIPILIALGITTFSIAPSAYLDVKKRVLDLKDKDIIDLQKADLFTDLDSIETIIREVTP